ncbi:hypothetical protein ACSLBF_05065 [Pseudoalteromonas sp. T1lg65]|uniref:hypothetical protein n=1 Tax=Pseudoalteromonas sp. T1lg65 TaxID=2077101 RepID=UPI003F79C408
MAYSIGKISVVQNSAVIEGAHTQFISVAKAQPGDLLYIKLNEQDYILQIAEVLSDTQLRLATLDGQAFNSPSSASNLRYGIVQNFTQTTTARLAKSLTELQAKWHRRERELTGWFASTEDQYEITNFLGQTTAIPTPTKIAELAQTALEASDALADMEQAIAHNQQSLESLEPNIAELNQQYQQSNALHSQVVIKHNGVQQLSQQVDENLAQVVAKAQQIESARATIDTQQTNVAQHANTVALDKTHSQASSLLAAQASQRAAASKQQAIEVENRATIMHDRMVLRHDQVSQQASQVGSLAESIEQTASELESTSQQVSQQSTQVSLDALHSKANAALCALSINTLMQQNANLNQAFTALLNDSLSSQTINQLFPV